MSYDMVDDDRHYEIGWVGARNDSTDVSIAFSLSVLDMVYLVEHRISPGGYS